jgi:hypothetical protein
LHRESKMAQSTNNKGEQHHGNDEQREIVRDSLESGLNNSIRGFQGITDQFSKTWGFDSPRAEEMARRA